MGKKARRLKLSKEQDPIIKRIRRKRPVQQDNQQDDESNGQNDHQEDQLNHVINAKDQNNQKGFYQQFLQKMNIKKNQQIEVEVNQRNQSILAKQQIKSKVGSKFRKANIYQLLEHQYQNHFEYDYLLIQDQICVKEQKQNILDDFYGKESLMNTLNNNVEFKDYKIEPKLKNKQLIDVGLEEEDIQIEELTKLQSIKENKFLIKLVDNFRPSLLEDYFDYIHTDPEEQNSAQFRNDYVNHILKHLQLKRNSYGFTRCKVLILSPFKGDAIDIIDRLIENKEVLNKERYDTEFCDEERLQEDDFRMGIAFSKKKEGLFKLYTNFEKADIIVASPLGLRLITGQKGDLKEIHFLSSIEILVIDRASAILMQNWQHLESILELTNNLPEHKHITQALDTISPYFFENMAKFYRQTIIYTNHYFSELNYIRQTYFSNYKGCISNRLYYLPLFKNSDNFQQEFRLFDAQNPEHGLEQRHIKFKKLWNDIENKEPEKYKKTVIFVQSYYDFIKLKNHFKSINSQVECISEYTKKPKVQSLIAKFNQNKINYVMITERAYYFEVCQLMKMRNLIFFQLPQHSFIYKSLIQDLHQIEKAKIINFVSKYDAYQLEYIVGTSITEDILQNKEIVYIL